MSRAKRRRYHGWGIFAQRGEVEKGIAYVEESVAIYERLKMPDANGVRSGLEWMKRQYGIS